MNLTSRSLTQATLILGLTLAAGSLAAQTTFTINSLGDSPAIDPGDGVCSTGDLLVAPPPIILECTLRAAIEEANASSGPVTIDIAQGIELTAGSISIIDVGSALPFLTTQVTIAGDTHPEWSHEDASHLYIRGPGTGTSSGLRFAAGAAGSTVRNVGVAGFGANGILISGGDNYTIDSNVLGGVWTPNASAYIGNGSDGIDIRNSSSNQISNNVIAANQSNGVRLRDGSGTNVFQDNKIGLVRGTGSEVFRPEHGNGGHGILIASSAGTGNSIGFFSGNTIANNESSGIRIDADEQLVLGNRIGVPHEGIVASGYESADYGNGLHGIQVTSSENTIGTSGAGRNIVGNSQTSGIDIAGTASNNDIAWNWIGTDPDGEDLGMTVGVRLDGGGGNLLINNRIAYNERGIYLLDGGGDIRRNTITDSLIGVNFRGPGQLGSSDIGDANVIGSNVTGVAVGSYVSAPTSTLVAIQNNYIGTDANGALIGNAIGVSVFSEDNTVWIGQSGRGNVIANGTSSGIQLRMGTSSVTVAGNLIGVHPNGTPMGNRTGISFSGGGGTNATSHRIGYSADAVINPETWQPGNGVGNIIAYNGDGGAIRLDEADPGSTGNVIRGNRIHSNGNTSTRGIDLGMEELDVGGGASGPNNLMNYPDFDAAATQYNAGTGEIDFRFRVQTTPANADYPLTVDFYLTDGETPQGKTFIGTGEYPATAAFEFRTGTIALPQSVPAGTWLVATATDSSGNTSQFSNQPIELELSDHVFKDRFE